MPAGYNLKLRERVVPLCQFQSSSSGQVWNSGTSQTGQISCKAKEAWPGDALSCFAFSDDYRFGILQSGIHWSWFIATCSKLKGDFRYTPESVFDTFPLAAEAKARRHQSGSGGSGDAAGVATGDDEEVELLAAAASYFSSRVFCLA